jgi:hypothetical protein
LWSANGYGYVEGGGVAPTEPLYSTATLTRDEAATESPYGLASGRNDLARRPTYSTATLTRDDEPTYSTATLTRGEGENTYSMGDEGNTYAMGAEDAYTMGAEETYTMGDEGVTYSMAEHVQSGMDDATYGMASSTEIPDYPLQSSAGRTVSNSTLRRPSVESIDQARQTVYDNPEVTRRAAIEAADALVASMDHSSHSQRVEPIYSIGNGHEEMDL